MLASDKLQGFGVVVVVKWMVDGRGWMGGEGREWRGLAGVCLTTVLYSSEIPLQMTSAWHIITTGI